MPIVINLSFNPSNPDDVAEVVKVLAAWGITTNVVETKSTTKPATTTKAATAAKAKPAATTKPEPEPDPFADPEPEYKLDDVRKALRAKAEASSRDAAIAVLKDVGGVESVGELENKKELWGKVIEACTV